MILSTLGVGRVFSLVVGSEGLREGGGKGGLGEGWGVRGGGGGMRRVVSSTFLMGGGEGGG